MPARLAHVGDISLINSLQRALESEAMMAEEQHRIATVLNDLPLCSDLDAPESRGGGRADPLAPRVATEQAAGLDRVRRYLPTGGLYAKTAGPAPGPPCCGAWLAKPPVRGAQTPATPCRLTACDEPLWFGVPTKERCARVTLRTGVRLQASHPSSA